jgi:two-component system, chemotaxis family, chemotaxis protein CheY
MKTLIVEDDFTSRLLLQKILAPYGESHIAINAKEAIRAFQLARKEKEPYDLVCLDVMMPGTDGLEVLRELKDIENHDEIPDLKTAKMIMTTAMSQKEAVRRALTLGVSGYFLKPVDREKLVGTIKDLGLIE